MLAMQRFEDSYGKCLSIGDLVVVNSDHPNADVAQGKQMVVGLIWDRENDDWNVLLGPADDVALCPTDGWTLSDLTPAEA